MKITFKVLIISGLAGLFFLTSGCATRGKGDKMTKEFTETNFHGLELGLNADAEVRIDSVFKIEITCEENILPFIETSVENGILRVKFDRNVWDVDGMKIKVSAPKWDNFKITGSGEIKVLNPISGSILTTKVSGSGDILIENAVFTSAKGTVSGSGTIGISGQSDALDCDVSGSGDVNCFDFLVNTSKIKVSGSGEVRVNVRDNLDVKISGSGDVIYKGNPILTVDVSGSGAIRKF